ncbi:hypothetical protein [Mycolicibacterium sphagni]|uniref:hypothetical protein n=1 Tax=Mycolicibacterium sphagni TaxID=1786 RepID=UPI0013FD4E6D|nr:hypothetical protein [Mycolicibacterium sphagni]
MKMMVQVLNVPDMDCLEQAELLVELRQSVIDKMQQKGHPFGSGYSVWAFYDD